MADIPVELQELQPDLSLEIGREEEATTAQQIASASAVLRILAAIQRDMDLISETRRLERDSISQIEARELAPLKARYAVYEGYVKNLAELIEWPKRKASHDTPHGTFGVRKPGATVRLVDKDKLLAWAKRHKPGAVLVEESVPWGEFKKEVDPNATVLPDGVERVPETITPFVRVGP